MQRPFAIWFLLKLCFIITSAQLNPKNVRLNEIRIMDSTRPVGPWYLELWSMNSGPSPLMGYMIVIISGSQIEVNILHLLAKLLIQPSNAMINMG